MVAIGSPVGGRWEVAVSMRTGSGRLRFFDGDEPRLRADGTPISRLLFLPAADCEIIDTWHSIGLRGTGSHDYSVTDVFVPAARSLSFREPPVERGPLYACPPSRCSAPRSRRSRSASHAMP